MKNTLRAIVCCLVFPLTATPLPADQLWSVHAFGIKVGELKVAMNETGNSYHGSGQFVTTGLVRVLARIRFDVRSWGRITAGEHLPEGYKGHIDTGKRVSDTEIMFDGPLPRVVNADNMPARPIPDRQRRGALDPMTMMWLTLRDQAETDLCTFDRHQFDGTRLAGLSLTRRHAEGDRITCSGSYDRLGGYTAEELAEMSTSSTAITYRRQDGVWRAEKIRMRTRHGPAMLIRRD